MLDDVLNLALHSPHEAVLRAALLMIAAALFMMLAIRMAMSLVSNARVNARKNGLLTLQSAKRSHFWRASCVARSTSPYRRKYSPEKCARCLRMLLRRRIKSLRFQVE